MKRRHKRTAKPSTLRAVPSSKNVYLCNICLQPFGSMKLIKKHFEVHKDSYPYECKECSCLFMHETSLEIHVNAQHKDSTKPFNRVPKSKTSGLKRQTNSLSYNREESQNKEGGSEDNQYLCLRCKSNYASYDSWKTHAINDHVLVNNPFPLVSMNKVNVKGKRVNDPSPSAVTAEIKKNESLKLVMHLDKDRGIYTVGMPAQENLSLKSTCQNSRQEKQKKWYLGKFTEPAKKTYSKSCKSSTKSKKNSMIEKNDAADSSSASGPSTAKHTTADDSSDLSPPPKKLSKPSDGHSGSTEGCLSTSDSRGSEESSDKENTNLEISLEQNGTSGCKSFTVSELAETTKQVEEEHFQEIHKILCFDSSLDSSSKPSDSNQSLNPGSVQETQILEEVDDFKCRLCSKVFTSDDEVQRHFSQDHFRVNSGPSILEPESPCPQPTANLSQKPQEPDIDPAMTLRQLLSEGKNNDVEAASAINNVKSPDNSNSTSGDALSELATFLDKNSNFQTQTLLCAESIPPTEHHEETTRSTSPSSIILPTQLVPVQVHLSQNSENPPIPGVRPVFRTYRPHRMRIPNELIVTRNASTKRKKNTEPPQNPSHKIYIPNLNLAKSANHVRMTHPSILSLRNQLNRRQNPPCSSQSNSMVPCTFASPTLPSLARAPVVSNLQNAQRPHINFSNALVGDHRFRRPSGFYHRQMVRFERFSSNNQMNRLHIPRVYNYENTPQHRSQASVSPLQQSVVVASSSNTALTHDQVRARQRNFTDIILNPAMSRENTVIVSNSLGQAVNSHCDITIGSNPPHQANSPFNAHLRVPRPLFQLGTAAGNINVTVTAGHAEATISAPRPDLTINVPLPDPTINAPRPRSTINAIRPDPTINVPLPDPTINAPRPRSTINAIRPDPTINVPRPDPTISAPRPDPTINAPRPGPTINATRPGPTINAIRPDPTINEPRPDPTINAPRLGPTINAPRPDPTINAPRPDSTINAPRPGPTVNALRPDPKIYAPQPDPTHHAATGAISVHANPLLSDSTPSTESTLSNGQNTIIKQSPSPVGGTHVNSLERPQRPPTVDLTTEDSVDNTVVSTFNCFKCLQKFTQVQDFQQHKSACSQSAESSPIISSVRSLVPSAANVIQNRSPTISSLRGLYSGNSTVQQRPLGHKGSQPERPYGHFNKNLSAPPNHINSTEATDNCTKTLQIPLIDVSCLDETKLTNLKELGVTGLIPLHGYSGINPSAMPVIDLSKYKTLLNRNFDCLLPMSCNSLESNK